VTESRIRVGLDSGIARLSWDDGSDPASLQAALTSEAEQLFASGVRRLEVVRPAGDSGGRRAALRSGFRVEGLQRAVVPLGNGGWGDAVLYSRLASDEFGGRTGFSAVMNTALPRKRLIAHVLMRDSRGRVLLCETQFKPDWELPGGIVEAGEPPRVGAVREVREELGIDLDLGRLMITDWMPPYLGWEDALELIYDGGMIEETDLGSLTLQPTEIRRVALVTLEEAASLVTPISHRRLSVASTLGPGESSYLENGFGPV
jgi:8-oxo-dGTP diphosphatase